MTMFEPPSKRSTPPGKGVRTRLPEELASPTTRVPDGPRSAMQGLNRESFDRVRLRINDQETTALGGSAARAVAYNDTIWLRPSEYRPGSIRTDAILAHELAHVRQQSAAGSAGSAHLEREADHAAALSLEPTGARRPPRVFGGLRLQRCAASDMPDLAQLDADAKAAVVRRVLQEDRYNRDDAVYTVFKAAAEQGQFVDLQGPLDMADVLSTVKPWSAARIGSLGPIIEGVETLTAKRSEIIQQSTHDYGLAYAQLFTAFIFDTTQDDQIRDVLRVLASERRLSDTIGSMPAIKDRLTARGINLADFPDRSREPSDVGRGLWTGLSDVLDSSQVARENRGFALQYRILDLPGPYAEAGQEITKKIFAEAMSPGNVALGAADYMLFGVPSGAYGFVAGTASGVGNLLSGNLEEGARELVPALITVATMLIGRAVAGPKGGLGQSPPSGGLPSGGGRVRFGAPGVGGVITLEQAIAQFPARLQGPVALLRATFTGREIIEGAGFVRKSAPAAALVEQKGVAGMRSLLNTGGDVPKARAILPAVAAAMTGSAPAKPGEAPATVDATKPKPMPTATEMETAASAATTRAALQTIVQTQVKDRKGKYEGPLPIFWPNLGGKGLPIDAPNPVNSIYKGRRLTRTKPSPARDSKVVDDFKAITPVPSSKAVHHVTPLMMGGPDSVDNLAAVFKSYHDAGHLLLREQHQLPPLGYHYDVQEHDNATPYVIVLII